MGKCTEQEQKILEMLESQGRLELSAVCGVLGVSEATARRYFARLEEDGKLLRVHGGVVARDFREYSYAQAASLNATQKLAIGAAAAGMIADYDHLFLDNGTTLRACGSALRELLETGKLKGISVVTNSLAYNETLAPCCKLTLTGGVVRPERFSLGGMEALSTLHQFRFDKALLGTDGIDSTGTLFTTDEETAAFAKTAIVASAQVLILADSSKLGRNAFVSYGCLAPERFTLVTDDGAPDDVLSEWKARGIRVVTVSNKNTTQEK